jgi:hypothetical protein
MRVRMIPCLSISPMDLFGLIDNRPADPALAELRRDEGQDHGLLAEHFGQIVAVHVVGGNAGVDLAQVAADVGGSRRMDARCRFAHVGRVRRALGAEGG